MSSKTPLKVVLCWHMHQPDYRDHIRNEFQLPWVYLHGIKDYVDMAEHLEAVPGAKAVVNFSPILLEQLQEYEQQITNYLQGAESIRDPLLAALDSPVFPADNEHRLTLIKTCLHSNQTHQIERFKAYRKLAQIADLVIHDLNSSAYISNQYLADLVTWYHLAWLGETVRRKDKRIQRLIDQGGGFTLHQRRILLQIISELLSTLRTRYAQLATNGQIELSMSPYAHPMIPLLLQFEAAGDAQPDIHLPILDSYPGGTERAEWHMRHGLKIFEDYFGQRPTGCWPSEGGISSATLKLITDCGFRWTATGESVLRNSIIPSSDKHDEAVSIHAAFCEGSSGLRLFARDDLLSDLIGFTYRSWHGDDAVADLLHRLETIAKNLGDGEDAKNAVVSIILDGENAWEYYPENGYHFLSALYRRLAEHPQLQLCTYQELVDIKPAVKLDKIIAGSWVFGTFSTWIGDEDKNRAWDILGDVKRVYDDLCANTEIEPERQARIDAQLASCEGSDWFWWLGNYNPAESVSNFEQLFRIHIANLYQMLGEEPPQYLSQTLAHGTGSPKLGGVIRPSQPNHVT